MIEAKLLVNKLLERSYSNSFLKEEADVNDKIMKIPNRISRSRWWKLSSLRRKFSNRNLYVGDLFDMVDKVKDVKVRQMILDWIDLLDYESEDKEVSLGRNNMPGLSGGRFP